MTGLWKLNYQRQKYNYDFPGLSEVESICYKTSFFDEGWDEYLPVGTGSVFRVQLDIIFIILD